MAFTCERNTGITPGSYLAFGNGASDLAGAVMPFAGRVIAVTLSQRSPAAGANTVRMTVNQTEAPLHEVTIDTTGNAIETAHADFRASSLPFAAGDALALKVIASSDSNATSVGTFFVVFDCPQRPTRPRSQPRNALPGLLNLGRPEVTQKPRHSASSA